MSGFSSKEYYKQLMMNAWGNGSLYNVYFLTQTLKVLCASFQDHSGVSGTDHIS